MLQDKMTTLSIVTVVANDRPGLKNTFDSLLSQEEKDFEWVIVDAESTDGTYEFILEAISEQKNFEIRVLSEPDDGIYDAMNKGVALAQGIYAMFLNSGDTLYNEKVLKKLLIEIDKCMNVSVVKLPILYGDYVRIFADGRSMPSRAKDPKYIYHSLPTSHQAILYPINFLKENLYDLNYRISGDYYITAKAFSLGYELRKISMIVSCFVTGGTASQNSALVMKENARVQREVLDMSLFPVFRSFVRRFINMMVIRAIHRKWPGSSILLNILNRVKG